jgi:thioredoxin-related protein
MKKLIFTCAILFGFGFTQAQGIVFTTKDWKYVQKQAKEQNKLIFVDVYTTWCGPCKLMDKNVFSNAKVGGFYNSKFISYKIDAEKGEGIAFAKKYAVNSYPSLLFIDGDGSLVLKKSGTIDVNEFIQFGKNALNVDVELKPLKTEYNNGNRSPKFMEKYLNALLDRNLPREEIASKYLNDAGYKKWGTIDNYYLIVKHISNPYGSILETMVAHRNEFNKASDSININYFIKSKYENYLKKSIDNNQGKKEVDKFLTHAKLRLKPKEAAILNSLALRLTAKKTKDWKSYAQLTMNYVNKNLLDNYPMLNNYAWSFYQNEAITDPSALIEALKWINIALKNNIYYNTLDTKAALLYKMGRKKEALLTAHKAVELAKRNGGNAPETLKLIKKINSKLK